MSKIRFSLWFSLQIATLVVHYGFSITTLLIKTGKWNDKYTEMKFRRTKCKYCKYQYWQCTRLSWNVRHRDVTVGVTWARTGTLTVAWAAVRRQRRARPRPESYVTTPVHNCADGLCTQVSKQNTTLKTQ